MIRYLVALAAADVALAIPCTIADRPAAPVLAAHMLLTALALLLRLRTAGRATLGIAMLGMLGPVAVLATLPFAPREVRPHRDEDAIFGPRWIRRPRRGHGVAAARLLDGRIHHAGPETLGSLAAILRHGDVAARRRALETVVRSFEPGLSPLIAQALTDRDQTIRALAAAASARVAQNLTLARTAPADDAAALAALLADHARDDVLLPDSQRRNLRRDAIALLAPGAPARAGLELEALWAAGDYAAIDRLAEDLAAAPEEAESGAVRLARWWRDAAAA